MIKTRTFLLAISLLLKLHSNERMKHSTDQIHMYATGFLDFFCCFGLDVYFSCLVFYIILFCFFVYELVIQTHSHSDNF